MRRRFVKNLISSFIIFIIMGGLFVLGIFIGNQNRPAALKITSVFNKESEVIAITDFDPFWEVWNTINEKHPNAANTTDQERVWGAIRGLTASLDDPYTVFFPPEDSKSFQEDIHGEFGGVGIEVGMRDKMLTVIAPLKDTPAYNAGVKAGDKIIKINDTVTSDLSIDEAVRLIRGEQGTTVTLSLFREENGNKPLEIPIVRGVIKVPVIETKDLEDDEIFVIELYNFSATSPDLFRDALKEFVESGYKRLILDLRGNPGGFLEASIDMASWFLPSGKVIVIEGGHDEKKDKEYRSKGYNIFTDALELVILIDGGSASASEILAGALQEHGKATLVGEKTYGKGSVQELISITKDTSLKVTIAEWLTPSGLSISEAGLTPDIEVELTIEDFEAGQDPQLDKAIEILKKD